VRIGGGAAAAAVVSLAIWILSSQAGLTPTIRLHHSAPSSSRLIDLRERPDFMAAGPAGRRWCAEVPGRRVCGVTAEGESGADALTRALNAAGYATRLSR
jgi:hypothetical protein